MSETTWRMAVAALIALIALSAYVDRVHHITELRDNGIASCERGNTLRLNQRAIVRRLLEDHPGDAALEAALRNTLPVDCQKANN